jgi:predicted metalloprotease
VATYRVTNEEKQQTLSLALPQDTSPAWVSLINVGSWDLKSTKISVVAIVDYSKDIPYIKQACVNNYLLFLSTLDILTARQGVLW